MGRPDSTQTRTLLEEAGLGDPDAFGRLFERHRPYLRRMAATRLDTRVRTRVDLSDVVQETQAEAFVRLGDYLQRHPMPFRLWLLKTLHQRLRKIHEQHLEAAKRSVDREVPLPDASALELADRLLNRGPSPSAHARREDLARQVRRLLAQLADQDREVLMLRNFEKTSNDEVALLLEISPEAAKKRHLRALLRLRKLWRQSGLPEP